MAAAVSAARSGVPYPWVQINRQRMTEWARTERNAELLRYIQQLGDA